MRWLYTALCLVILWQPTTAAEPPARPRLAVLIIFDQMRGDYLARWAELYGKDEVVALSLKDRAAVLPGGRKPDACYWFSTSAGKFVTSTYYRDRLHPWVEDFNKAKLVDGWFGKDWVRLRNNLDYEKYSGLD